MKNHYQSLNELVEALRRCRRCPQMQFSPVSGGPVSSRVILVDQASGIREPAAAPSICWESAKDAVQVVFRCCRRR
jgi:hypothetical protein